MGYNIDPVLSGGQPVADGTDGWAYTVDISDPSVSVVSGQFASTSAFGSIASTWSASAVVTNGFGTLSLNAATGAFTFTIDRDAVFASGNDGVVTFTITGTAPGLLGGTDSDFVRINILICVVRGTLIATPGGEVPVEELRPGDLVLTADGREEPIRWIASRHLSRQDLAAEPSFRPIRIAAGAFGDGRPARDLRVSPQHRVFLTGWHAQLLFGEDSVLVPAKGLVDDCGIGVDHARDEVDYFHLLFDRHEVILTEGLPTESFFPGPHALSEIAGAAREELLRLFPEFAENAAPFDPAGPGLRSWEARLLPRRLS
jgi:hypothetical protein